MAREVIRKFLLGARCSSCSTNYASDIPAASASFFTQLAGGDSYVAVWRLPVCGRAQHGSLPVGPRACRSVSRSQSRCAIARCYSDPHTVGSGVSRLPVTAAFPVECIRFPAICASVSVNGWWPRPRSQARLRMRVPLAIARLTCRCCQSSRSRRRRDRKDHRKRCIGW